MPPETTEQEAQPQSTGQEPQAAAPAPPLDILVNDLLREGVVQTSRDHEARVRGEVQGGEPPEPAEDEPEEEEEVVEDEEPDDAAEAEPSPEEPEPAPEQAEPDQARVDQYASLLAKGGQRWSSIPTAMRGKAIDRALEQARNAAMAEVREAAAQAINLVRDQSYSRGLADAEAAAEAAALKAEIDSMSDAELGEFARNEPARYAAYLQQSQPQQPQAVAQALETLRNDPEVRAQLQPLYNQDPHRYDDTEAGRFAIVADVRAAQALIANARAQAAREPVRQKAAARQQAAKTRAKQTVDAGSGNGKSASNVDSIRSLAGDGYKDLLRRGVVEANKPYTR